MAPSLNYTFTLSDPTNFVFYPAEHYYNETFSELVHSSLTIDLPLFENFKEKSNMFNFAFGFLFTLAHWKHFVKIATHQAHLEYKIQFVLKKIAKTIWGAFMIFFLIVIMMPIYFFFLIAKIIAIFITYYEEGNGFTVPTGNDALWGTNIERRKPIISTLLKFEGELDLEYIRRSFKEKIIDARFPNGTLQFRKLKQIFVNCHGYHMWKDAENFDIRQHIKSVNLETFSSEIETDLIGSCNERSGSAEDLVCRYLSHFGPDAIPNDRPQWEIICFTGKNKRFVIYLYNFLSARARARVCVYLNM